MPCPLPGALTRLQLCRAHQRGSGAGPRGGRNILEIPSAKQQTLHYFISTWDVEAMWFGLVWFFFFSFPIFFKQKRICRSEFKKP